MLIAAETVIRLMTESDLDCVLAIEKASYQKPWTREHFLHEINAPHSFPFVAEYNGSLAGYVCLTSLFEEAQILDIAIVPDQREKGIATALLKHAIERAVQKGAELLSLEVRSTNSAAISLYEKLGFIRTGCRFGYYENRDDAVLMEKNLKEIN